MCITLEITILLPKTTNTLCTQTYGHFRIAVLHDLLQIAGWLCHFPSQHSLNIFSCCEQRHTIWNIGRLVRDNSESYFKIHMYLNDIFPKESYNSENVISGTGFVPCRFHRSNCDHRNQTGFLLTHPFHSFGCEISKENIFLSLIKWLVTYWRWLNFDWNNCICRPCMIKLSQFNHICSSVPASEFCLKETIVSLLHTTYKILLMNDFDLS